MFTLTETFSVRLKITNSLEVTLKQPNKKRLPKPRPNRAALPKLKSLENEVGSNAWIEAWFEYLSEDKKDRDNIRDLIISKLPNKVLYRVGFVPSYKETMFNYAKNPFLIPFLRHKKDYWLTSFCIKEAEEGDKKKSIKEARKSVKIEEEEVEVVVEVPPTDSYLDGVDVEDVHIQIELLQGEKIISLGNFKVRGEGDNYVQLSGEPYVQVGEFTTKKGDLAFGSATCSFNIFSKKELLRKVQAYDHIKEKWVKMPSLNFLPPKVNGMLGGEGGLLLLSGDIRPYVDPNAPLPMEEPINGDGDEPKKKMSISEAPPEEGDKAITKGEEGEVVEGEGEQEAKKKSVIVIPRYKPPEFPTQHILVVCNPIARTFRILPPMHVNLENMVARMVVHPSSRSYVIYILGFHRRIKECIEAEGMRVAIYKSVTQKWEIFVVPSCRIFRPGVCSYNRALPLITNFCEGPTLFMGGQLVTNKVGVFRPVVLGYRLRTRTWKAYSWPPLSVTEPPQVLEVNNNLYIVARGASKPAIVTIWTFIQYVYEYPDCKLVTMMPQVLYNALFTPNIKSSWDCVSSMDCITLVEREFATFIVSYNVKTKKWLDPMKRYPGYMSGLTFLGNWNYEIAPYALV
ncbi:hypothetical protein M758_10G080800 [Ceratodon purpureus]|uniref:Uncharacterized protein n=1 Tax=Ceratodon purpureus TaxID=3225 RepID=A0A8T0GI26_CERPU|nr:hypothetical protein KC19_10G082100 [Ceratodon purpureus]KAG0603269.1 hypothetical protein M758_10G080800 [Ceratodon purpureus]